MTATSELGIIIALGIAAQWIGAAFRIPAILLLLGLGLAAGPGFGLLDPDALFGNLLLPVVSLSVAIILFEGGLSLRFRELRQIGRPLALLVTIGMLVTWGLAAFAARWLLDFDWDRALLIGAILVVTGPTVIAPLLRHVRLRGNAAALLRWEGIVIDPIGALFAVLVFEVVRHGPDETAGMVLWAVTKTIIAGGGLGWLLGTLLVAAFERFRLPDALQVPVTFAAVVSSFVAANAVQDEAGLLAVTVLGIVMANQKRVPIHHLVEFKENLAILLISVLFIVLSARLPRAAIAEVDGWAVLFLLAILMIRLVAVGISTLGSKLTWPERLFVGCLAPRGIVAAAVASVFALHLSAHDPEEVDRLSPIVFWTIIGTVSVYGLTARPLANWLGLAATNPQGTVFVGAQAWARAIATALKDQGKPVVVVDSNWSNIVAARWEGLPAVFGSVLSESSLDEIDLGDMRRMLALTANDELNSLACLRLTEFFGRQNVFQLPFTSNRDGKHEAVPARQRGRFLLDSSHTYSAMTHWAGPQPVAKVTALSADFDFAAFREMHGDRALPVLVIRESGDVEPILGDSPDPKPGQKVISLMQAEATTPAEPARRASGQK
jgi:NhaP-type Na+/H+ or K+/H+ antiporter